MVALARKTEVSPIDVRPSPGSVVHAQTLSASRPISSGGNHTGPKSHCEALCRRGCCGRSVKFFGRRGRFIRDGVLLSLG